jgi:peptidoglycan-associated lipoprotein
VKRFSQIALVLMLATAPILAGCAMTPNATSDSSSAPSPGGTMAGGSMNGGRAVGSAAADRSGSSAQGNAARPNPKDFTAKTDLRDIRFEFDSYVIRAEDAQLLDQNADLMKANPSWLVLIEGHADQRGTPDYNLALSERRARASMNYLVSRGVRANRISVMSYGEQRPICSEASEDCWSQNRRAHFLVKGK